MPPVSAPPADTGHYFASHLPFLDAPRLQSSRQFSLTLGGQTLLFATGKGIFSKSTLDEGTGILIGRLPRDLGHRFLDLGCGWGPVAAFAASRHPQCEVAAVDTNPRAVQFASHNFGLNQLVNATAWCGNGIDACRSATFSTVACNPPVRAGNAVMDQLFAGAHRVLEPGGSLWVVLRTAQGAKSWQKRLAARFGNCETVAIESGYRVLCSRRELPTESLATPGAQK